jgi:hypothetical protein
MDYAHESLLQRHSPFNNLLLIKVLLQQLEERFGGGGKRRIFLFQSAIEQTEYSLNGG